ncbi:MAG: prepilin-type N-terminal cleavage/methylation domain-containing protein, partial [Planctomycetota bacterium]|nr:prepilin-type N-terminal cleavage/methylation domain-containing protein [Planctomycetota bacterium]
MISTPRQNRAFSLIEVLMSIFILGIGVIAIASLLPAGIKQQQNAKNDAYGPVVADSALATLRSRLSPSDFGGDDQLRDTTAPD